MCEVGNFIDASLGRTVYLQILCIFDTDHHVGLGAELIDVLQPVQTEL